MKHLHRVAIGAGIWSGSYFLIFEFPIALLVVLGLVGSYWLGWACEAAFRPGKEPTQADYHAGAA